MKYYVDSCGYVRFVATDDLVSLFMIMSASAIVRHVSDGWLQPSAIKRISYQRGYISRRDFDALSAPVLYSRRLKLFYILVPCWESSRYCRRFYLEPDIFDSDFAVNL